ncbi:MAG: hypothetical protein HDR13_14140 [Lachnospiraceae bacterium]|nr:hypothetical protein [Lachnospiraceae bacterium]
MKLSRRKIFGILVLLICILSACGEKHEAYLRGSGYLFIDDERYIMTDGVYEESNTKICKTSDGHSIYEVVGDKEHNYVVSRSYWDARLFVKESHTPDRTIVSAVCFGWDRDHYISDEEIIGCVLSLESNEEFFDDTDDLMESRSKGKKIHIKYGDEAVGECVGSVFRYEDQCMYYSRSRRMVTVLTDDQRDLIQEYLY